MNLNNTKKNTMIRNSVPHLEDLFIKLMKSNPGVIKLHSDIYKGKYDKRMYPFVTTYITLFLYHLMSHIKVKCPFYKNNFKLTRSVYEYNARQVHLFGMYTLSHYSHLDMMCVVSTNLKSINNTKLYHSPTDIYDHFNIIFRKRKIPHIGCSYGTSVCPSGLSMKARSYQNNRLSKQVEKWKNMKKQDILSSSLSYTLVEAPTRTIHKFLQQNTFDNHEWDALLFQLFFTMCVVKKEIPNFVHNNLSPKYIHLKKVPAGGQFVYKIRNEKYYVPNYGYIIKVLPSVYSHANGNHNNRMVHNELLQSKLGLHPDNNEFYDLHLFCNTLYFTKNVSSYMKGLIKKWVPPGMLCKESNDKVLNGRLRCGYTTPVKTPSFQEILQSTLFKRYKTLSKKSILFYPVHKI